ncbi:endoglucanase [Flammeovirgaceae bacterium 311]|nr:endoglucanase [Flammeovirgaceae bacterium 311]
MKYLQSILWNRKLNGIAVLFSCCLLLFSHCTQQESTRLPNENSVTPPPTPDAIPFVYADTSSAWRQTAVGRHGKLQVRGNTIVDKNGEPVQLRGMSLFWSQWIGQYWNKQAVQWLRDDWKINVIRAAMAVDHGGYATNPAQEKAKVMAVVEAAIELGIYVIIDFHVHEANKYEAEAKVFFAEMAQRYGQYPNVIYEPWNEPLQTGGWRMYIKPYHESIIGVIRQYDEDNLIVCGTGHYSMKVDEASLDPVKDVNVAYTLHYYAGTHQQALRRQAQKALERGAALFVTEYGVGGASSNGTINEEEARLWWDFLDEHKISHCNWSVADKEEVHSALLPGASPTGGWMWMDLTPSGRLVRGEIRAKNP